MTKKKKTSSKAAPSAPSDDKPAPAQEAHAPDADAAAADAAVAAAKAKQAEEEPLQMQLLRLRADFDNFRKRTQRERGELSLRANEELLLELLPVLDHFELGMETARQHETDQAVMDGFQLVFDQFRAALQKAGLTPVDAEGHLFDPHLHEAATYLPSEEHPEDTVVAQTRRGYKLGDRLLRAAQVVVSSGPVSAGSQDG